MGACLTVLDFSEIKSHPNKLLSDHLLGVESKASTFYPGNASKISSLFHDLGKLNPNFQKKIRNIHTSEYSNHAYLSAIAWIYFVNSNPEIIKSLSLKRIDILSILALIAHHHGDLPNFEDGILKKSELLTMFHFLKSNEELFFSDFLHSFVNQFMISNKFSVFLEEYDIDRLLKSSICNDCKIHNPIEKYIEIKQEFACLIKADKLDASGLAYGYNLRSFSSQFTHNLDSWLNSFSATSELNEIRSNMREEAIGKLNDLLSVDSSQRVFSLTAPTGSGKTAMLLSLASTIIKKQGNHRIIYVLPFLSIIEQVSQICSVNLSDEIQRIDSKSDNHKIQEIQKRLDSEQNEDILKDLLSEEFREATFDFPFIVTTFVKFFESLLSNRNATLLKLPNFANSIFLIDEIQALPPRLYGFFVLYLSIFCKKLNSYCIVSTATMPNFSLPDNLEKNEELGLYSIPEELLNQQYFQSKVFNRCRVQRLKSKVNLEELVQLIEQENKSTLIILNTIKDSKNIFRMLGEKDNSNIYLLNTRFIVDDRNEIIETVKNKLENREKVILVSTQLIEAGVDIDFPIVYRDMCPLPSLIQSAGRCNRNNKISQGKVVLFELQDGKKSSWQYIYKDLDKNLLEFTSKIIPNAGIDESELFEKQKEYFRSIASNMHFGMFEFSGEKKESIFLMDAIKKLEFENIGKFKLIQEKENGKEYSFYIRKETYDNSYVSLIEMRDKFKSLPLDSKFEDKKVIKIEISNLIKKMSNRILRIQIKDSDSFPFILSDFNNPIFGIHLLDPSQYDSRIGYIDLDGII